MFHTVYKTTNLVNGKYYFGYHKTNNVQDGYLGSGKYLKNAIAKYGEENFKKDVLFTYMDAESAFGKESELVDAFRNSPFCMNLRQGGSGGFDYINCHGLTTGLTVKGKEKIRQSKLGIKRPSHIGLAVAKANRKRVGWHHPEERRKRISASNQRTKALRPQKGWNKGLHLSEATKNLLREAAVKRTGEKNPSFGKVYIHNPITGQRKRAPSNDAQILIEQGWKSGAGKYDLHPCSSTH
jgi:hypothetical protein